LPRLHFTRRVARHLHLPATGHIARAFRQSRQLGHVGGDAPRFVSSDL
jgi:hypothetical protein